LQITAGKLKQENIPAAVYVCLIVSQCGVSLQCALSSLAKGADTLERTNHSTALRWQNQMRHVISACIIAQILLREKLSGMRFSPFLLHVQNSLFA